MVPPQEEIDTICGQLLYKKHVFDLAEYSPFFAVWVPI